MTTTTGNKFVHGAQRGSEETNFDFRDSSISLHLTPYLFPRRHWVEREEELREIYAGVMMGKAAAMAAKNHRLFSSRGKRDDMSANLS